jgi:allantoate deiminase
MTALATTVIDTCLQIARCTEEPGRTTRTFLSPPMRDVHRLLGEWMERIGMTVRVDSAGNLRGVTRPSGPRLVIGSHLDTVPNAGAFDGILGVVAGIALAEIAGPEARVALEVIGFSEEEGVRR